MQSKVVFVFLVVVILATLASCATSTTATEGPRTGLFSKGPQHRCKYCGSCMVMMEFLAQSAIPIKYIIGVECLKFLPDDVCKDVSKIEDFIIQGIINLRKNPEQMCELINLC